MKKFILFVAIVGTVTLTGLLSSSVAGVTRPTRERAVITFDQPVQLLDVTLKGEYLFVHDDAAMARGEACTYVYKGVVESAARLVASFHCIPEQRKKATHLTVRSAKLTSGLTEITEFQFAGSAEGHRVPKTH